jgi:sigma-B regulation protein RsbU (phosphoserine phosphatase)
MPPVQVPGTELAEVVLGALMIALGLISVAFACLAPPRSSGDRAPLWFGLFVLLYGVRLAADSELVRPLFPFSERFWAHLDVGITYLILTPAGLFTEALLGPGWRNWLHRAWQALLVYGLVAVGVDLTTGRPGSMIWLNPLAVVIPTGIAAAHALALWRSMTGALAPSVRVALATGVFFGAVAVTETITKRGLIGDGWELEPFAMLVFVSGLAYLVAQRALTIEHRLVEVSKELRLARDIQQSILPAAMPRLAGVTIASRFMPMTEVGGDFYDFVHDSEGRVGVIVADVSGHGVPAALVASMVKVAFASESEQVADPGSALTAINRTLWGKTGRAYVTACLAFVDADRRRLFYGRAGHPPPLLRRADGCVHQLSEGGLAIGFVDGVAYESTSIAIGPGDRVVLYTDGVLEATNPLGEFFGDSRFGQVVADDGRKDPEAFADHVVQELRRWTAGASLQDDATLVVVDLTN